MTRQKSFSNSCRSEALENFKFSKKDCCNISFLKGYFFNDDLPAEDDVFIHATDVEKSARSVKKLLSRYGVGCEISESENSFLNSNENLIFKSTESIKALQKLITTEISECRDCKTKFLIGVFVSRCTVVDPGKEYHLEFVLKDEIRCDRLLNTLSDMGLDFKKTVRKSSFALYTKNSEVIEDLLATVGASNSFMDFVQNKVEKDVRNVVNRRNNAETANIAKAVKSSYKYRLAVEKLRRQGTFDSLPEDIKRLAVTKYENPEMPLSRLALTQDPPMTKSTVKRKLDKLCEIARIEE